MLKLPKPPLPDTLLCGTKEAGRLSTSLTLRVPLVLRSEARLPSVTDLVVSPLITAASLVPVMVTLTTWVVPSLPATVKLSV